MNNNRQSRMTKGSPDQFANALKRKINELGGDIEACDDVINAASGNDDWWKKYYNVVNAEECAQHMGCDVSEMFEFESLDGYEYEHLGYLIVKEEYADVLDEYDGLDLVCEGGRTFPATFVHDRMFDATDEIQDTLAMYDDIDACSDVVTAASGNDDDFSIPKIDSMLTRNIGSRSDCIRALLVNLGDGGTGLIFQEPNSGDYCMAKIYDEIHADTYDTTADIINEVLSTWGKSLPESASIEDQPQSEIDDSEDEIVDDVEDMNNDSYDVETFSGEVVSGEIIADYEAKRYSGSETIISQLKLTNGRTVWAVWNPLRGIYSQVDKNNYKIFNKVN